MTLTHRLLAGFGALAAAGAIGGLVPVLAQAQPTPAPPPPPPASQACDPPGGPENGGTAEAPDNDGAEGEQDGPDTPCP